MRCVMLPCRWSVTRMSVSGPMAARMASSSAPSKSGAPSATPAPCSARQTASTGSAAWMAPTSSSRSVSRPPARSCRSARSPREGGHDLNTKPISCLKHPAEIVPHARVRRDDLVTCLPGRRLKSATSVSPAQNVCSCETPPIWRCAMVGPRVMCEMRGATSPPRPPLPRGEGESVLRWSFLLPLSSRERGPGGEVAPRISHVT